MRGFVKNDRDNAAVTLGPLAMYRSVADLARRIQPRKTRRSRNANKT